MIKKFNEEAFWRKSDWKKPLRLLSTDDLYIKNPKAISSPNGPKDKSSFLYGMRFQDLSLVKDIDRLQKYKGIFVEQDDYFQPYKFSDGFYGGIWKDISNVFPKIREISDRLGLKVGAVVFNGYENLTIEDIYPFVFYNIDNEVFKKGINTVCTLCYKLSDDKIYQPSKIKLVNSSIKMSIVAEEIEDNFLDLIDEKRLTFACKQINSVYKCKLVVDMNTPQLLDDVSTRLLTMTKRLEVKNITIKITSISVNLIEFDAIQN